MATRAQPLDPATGQELDAVLERLQYSNNVGADLLGVLDIAIKITGADMGTVQRFDESQDCLTIVASRGLSDEVLTVFEIVRRETNTTCAAALMRHMGVFVEDVSTSYLFVGTRELDILRACGIAAAQSTPLISSTDNLWGVFTTHFHEPQMQSQFDHGSLDRLAVQVADSLERRYGPLTDQHFHGKYISDESHRGG